MKTDLVVKPGFGRETGIVYIFETGYGCENGIVKMDMVVNMDLAVNMVIVKTAAA